MKSPTMLLQCAALLWASFSIAAAFKAGLRPMPRADELPSGPSIPLEYCATINTADMDPFNSIYQSEGRCYTNCTDLNYALAIVQEKNCWCSNLIPNSDDRTSLSDCSSPCPGYPPDHCGGDGVFGYIAAGGGNPTGTAPAGGSATALPVSSTAVTSNTRTVQSSTAQPTVTVTLSPTLSSASRSSTFDSSSSSTSTESSSIASTTQPPVVQTVTIGGTVRTVTATPNPPHATGAIQPSPEKDDKSMDGGTIAGIIIGVLGGLGLAAAAIFFWRRRRQKELNEKGMASPVGRGGSPAMMTTTTTGEGSAAGGSAGLDSNKRRSYLMPVDPRLDPFAKGIYIGDPNRSRESFNSLQDNQDYSRRVHDPPRVLRAINPDPDDDD